MIELLNCDCMTYMAGLPDKAFDLACVDPPYGIDWMKQIQNPNVKANWKVYENKAWDSAAPSREYFDELKRVSSNQIIWGANYMAENAVTSTPCWVIWDKCQEFSGATFEMAWTSFKSPAKAFRLSRVEAYANKTKIHPTQKPVALYEWLLTNYAKPGQRILDTHLGSGSSAIAANNLGFYFVGMELDPDYYAAAVKRFEQHKAQATLFQPDDYDRVTRDEFQESFL
jgi:site-specific DNA-methyltransferase (adenine-specific)